MESEPVILILDDERTQIITLRAVLEAVGRVQDFCEPVSALEFAKNHQVDAAIVDVHMPKMALNGMEFMRAIREFDQDLCILVRTGDASAEIADGALEVQAFRRVIKSRTSVPEMRELTRTAIAETRRRRTLRRDAGAAAGISRELERTLGTIEDELSVSDAHKSVVQSMRNQVTAMAGYAELWVVMAEQLKNAELTEHAKKNRRIVGKMVTDMDAFFEGPFGQSSVDANVSLQADVNGTLDMLQKRFRSNAQWATDHKTITLVGLSQSLLLPLSPVKLLTGLRHAIEFGLKSAAPQTCVGVKASFVSDFEDHLGQIREANLVFNRPARKNTAGYVCFAITAGQVHATLEDIRHQFHKYPDDPRTGNLHMLPFSLGEERCAIVAFIGKVAGLTLHVLTPVAR